MARIIWTYLSHVNLTVKSTGAIGIIAQYICLNEKISAQNNKECLLNSNFTEHNILSHMKEEIW